MTRARINIAGVRERYPVDPATISRKCKAGQFPAPHYIGGRRYWFADEVDAWLESQSTATPTVAPPRDGTP